MNNLCSKSGISFDTDRCKGSMKVLKCIGRFLVITPGFISIDISETFILRGQNGMVCKMRNAKMHAMLFTILNCVSFSPCIVLCKFHRFCTKRMKGILYLQKPPNFLHKSQNQNFKKASVQCYTFTFIHITFTNELLVLKSRSSLICYRDTIGVKEFGCPEVISNLCQLNHVELILTLRVTRSFCKLWI